MMLIFFILVAGFRSSISGLLDKLFYPHYDPLILINEGDTAELRCYLSDNPYTRVEWQRERIDNTVGQNLLFPNGKKIFYGNVLKIPSFNKTYNGRYVCSSNYIYGRVSKFFDVRVNFTPRIDGLFNRPQCETEKKYKALVFCRKYRRIQCLLDQKRCKYTVSRYRIHHKRKLQTIRRSNSYIIKIKSS